MSEAWDRMRRRYVLVEEVLGHVDRAGIGVLPKWQERIDAEYDADGLGGFLRDVHRRWQRAFDARLDAVLESDAPDPATGATRLWRTLAASQPAARLVLDEYAGHAALVAAEARHRQMLRTTIGVDPAQVQADAQVWVTVDMPVGEPARRACRLTGLVRTRVVRRRHAAPQAA